MCTGRGISVPVRRSNSPGASGCLRVSWAVAGPSTSAYPLARWPCRLCCATRCGDRPLDRLRHDLRLGAQPEEGAHEQIHRDRRITGLHLRHPGLAGAHPLRDLFLRQISGLAILPEFLREGDLHLDEGHVSVAEVEELLDSGNTSASCLEALPGTLVHACSSFRASW